MYRGERVLLRAFLNGDEHALLAWANDLGLQKMCYHDLILPKTSEDVYAFMRAQGGISRGVYQFGVEALENGRFLGCAGFTAVDSRNQTGEAALYIGDEGDRRRGYGTDTLRVLCRFGFDEINLRKIKARILAGNAASRALFEKVGFHQEGLEEQEVYREGQWQDVALYALFRGE